MAGNLSQMGFGGRSHVTSLPCGFSTPVGNLAVSPGISTHSGVTVPGVLKTLLNVTGAPIRLNALKFSSVDITARDVRVVITIDGAVVFDNTVTVTDANSRLAVGVQGGSATPVVVFQPVDALYSLKVEFSCSLAENDKLIFSYNYEVR